MTSPDPHTPRFVSAPHRHLSERLQAFSGDVARRLPGSWTTSAATDFADSPVRAEVMDRLWDHGHVEWALQDFVHREAALLTGPADESFVVLIRPQHPAQYLVAALAPPGTDGVPAADDAPHGIAIPGDPSRAAADIVRRLLPRYRRAVQAVRAPALREAHRRARQALADWDAVSDSFCDEQGMPLDETAYGIRQARRDAEAWLPFETALFYAPAVIDHAESVLPALPIPAATAAVWRYQLRALREAVEEGIRIRDTWKIRLSALLDHQDAPDRQRAFTAALDDRNAEGWHATTVFIDHAPVLHTIADAEGQLASAAAARTSGARARSTTTGSTGSPAPPGPSARPHRPSR